MNFRKATDELLASITLEDLAKAIGGSVQALRQARAAEESSAFRKPPQEWEEAVVRLANARARKLLSLVKHLKNKRNSYS
jgi:hypothetical protein